MTDERFLKTIGGPPLSGFPKNLECVPMDRQTSRTHLHTIYPCRDIDDTFVVIPADPGNRRKTGEMGNSCRIHHRIEILPEGYP